MQILGTAFVEARRRRWRLLVAILLACCCLSTGTARALTVLGGSSLTSRGNVDGATGILFCDIVNTVTASGQADAWSIYAGQAGGSLEMEVYRPTVSTWQFVASSSMVTVPSVGVNTFNLAMPISVQAGDVICWYYPVGTAPAISFGYGISGQNTIWNLNYATNQIPTSGLGGNQQNLATGGSYISGGVNYGAFGANSYVNRQYSIQLLGTFTPLPEPGLVSLGCLLALSLLRRRRSASASII